METLAIVGASLAGLSAARAARAQGFSGRLLVIGDERERPYDRPPLSKDFLAGKIGVKHLMLEEDEGAGDPLQAEWILGTRAGSFDAAAKAITLGDGRTVVADGVVIATGASARTLPELAGLSNVFTLRTLQDAQDLAPELVPGSRLLVIGAGFIGAEVASTARGLGMEVTVVCNSKVPLTAALGTEMGSVMARLHEMHGVELICDAGIDSYYSCERNVTGVRLSTGEYRPADVVLVGIGAVPNIAWLAGSGVELGDGVICDRAGRTNVPGVVAVGDCAAWFDERAGLHRRLEHWTGALERADVAVQALLNEDAPQESSNLPYFWSDQYGVTLQFVGHANDADRVAIEAGELDTHNFLAVYYRGEEPIGVLGANQPRLFTRWRRQLNSRLRQPVPAAS